MRRTQAPSLQVQTGLYQRSLVEGPGSVTGLLILASVRLRALPSLSSYCLWRTMALTVLERASWDEEG